jgi:hypothetical protein
MFRFWLVGLYGGHGAVLSGATKKKNPHKAGLVKQTGTVNVLAIVAPFIVMQVLSLPALLGLLAMYTYVDWKGRS